MNGIEQKLKEFQDYLTKNYSMDPTQAERLVYRLRNQARYEKSKERYDRLIAVAKTDEEKQGLALRWKGISSLYSRRQLAGKTVPHGGPFQPPLFKATEAFAVEPVKEIAAAADFLVKHAGARGRTGGLPKPGTPEATPAKYWLGKLLEPTEYEERAEWHPVAHEAGTLAADLLAMTTAIGTSKRLLGQTATTLYQKMGRFAKIAHPEAIPGVAGGALYTGFKTPRRLQEGATSGQAALAAAADIIMFGGFPVVFGNLGNAATTVRNIFTKYKMPYLGDEVVTILAENPKLDVWQAVDIAKKGRAGAFWRPGKVAAEAQAEQDELALFTEKNALLQATREAQEELRKLQVRDQHIPSGSKRIVSGPGVVQKHPQQFIEARPRIAAMEGRGVTTEIEAPPYTYIEKLPLEKELPKEPTTVQETIEHLKKISEQRQPGATPFDRFDDKRMQLKDTATRPPATTIQERLGEAERLTNVTEQLEKQRLMGVTPEKPSVKITLEEVLQPSRKTITQQPVVPIEKRPYGKPELFGLEGWRKEKALKLFDFPELAPKGGGLNWQQRQLLKTKEIVLQPEEIRSLRNTFPEVKDFHKLFKEIRALHQPENVSRFGVATELDRLRKDFPELVAAIRPSTMPVTGHDYVEPLREAGNLLSTLSYSIGDIKKLVFGGEKYAFPGVEYTVSTRKFPSDVADKMRTYKTPFGKAKEPKYYYHVTTGTKGTGLGKVNVREVYTFSVTSDEVLATTIEHDLRLKAEIAKGQRGRTKEEVLNVVGRLTNFDDVAIADAEAHFIDSPPVSFKPLDVINWLQEWELTWKYSKKSPGNYYPTEVINPARLQKIRNLNDIRAVRVKLTRDMTQAERDFAHTGETGLDEYRLPTQALKFEEPLDSRLKPVITDLLSESQARQAVKAIPDDTLQTAYDEFFGKTVKYTEFAERYPELASIIKQRARLEDDSTIIPSSLISDLAGARIKRPYYSPGMAKVPTEVELGGMTPEQWRGKFGAKAYEIFKAGGTPYNTPDGIAYEKLLRENRYFNPDQATLNSTLDEIFNATGAKAIEKVFSEKKLFTLNPLQWKTVAIAAMQRFEALGKSETAIADKFKRFIHLRAVHDARRVAVDMVQHARFTRGRTLQLLGVDDVLAKEPASKWEKMLETLYDSTPLEDFMQEPLEQIVLTYRPEHYRVPRFWRSAIRVLDGHPLTARIYEIVRAREAFAQKPIQELRNLKPAYVEIDGVKVPNIGEIFRGLQPKEATKVGLNRELMSTYYTALQDIAEGSKRWGAKSLEAKDAIRKEYPKIAAVIDKGFNEGLSSMDILKKYGQEFGFTQPELDSHVKLQFAMDFSANLMDEDLSRPVEFYLTRINKAINGIQILDTDLPVGRSVYMPFLEPRAKLTPGEEPVTDPRVVLQIYFQALSKRVAYEPVLTIYNKDVLNALPLTLKEWVGDYFKRVLGRPTKADVILYDVFKQMAGHIQPDFMFGFGESLRRYLLAHPRPASGLANTIKGAYFIKALGLNFWSPMVNRTQSPIMMVGGVHGIENLEISALGKTGMKNYFVHMKRVFGKSFDEAFKASGLERDLDKGEVDVREIGRFLRKFYNESGRMFRYSELRNKNSSTVFAFEKALADGKSHQEALLESILFSDLVHFNLGITGRSRMMSSPWLSTLLQFSTYKIEMLDNIGAMLNDAVLRPLGRAIKARNPSPAETEAMKHSLKGILRLVSILHLIGGFDAHFGGLLNFISGDDPQVRKYLKTMDKYTSLQGLIKTTTGRNVPIGRAINPGGLLFSSYATAPFVGPPHQAATAFTQWTGRIAEPPKPGQRGLKAKSNLQKSMDLITHFATTELGPTQVSRTWKALTEFKDPLHIFYPFADEPKLKKAEFPTLESLESLESMEEPLE